MAVNLADLSLPQLEGLKNQLEQVIEKCHCNEVLPFDIFIESWPFKK